MTVLRNGYGRQVASDVFSAKSTLKSEPLEMVFIRGPIIERIGPDIEILAKYAGKPAMVRKGKLAGHYLSSGIDFRHDRARILSEARRGIPRTCTTRYSETAGAKSST